jgi:hypothetical protein
VELFASFKWCAVVCAALLAESSALAAEEAVPEMLAAQIRAQGFSCEKALEATMDATLSTPDHDVWVLKCDNATYRVSRAPDMAAKVQQIKSR